MCIFHIVGAGIRFPPARQTISIVIGARIRPRIRRAGFIPHTALGGGDALGVSVTERQHIGAFCLRITQGEAIGAVKRRIVSTSHKAPTRVGCEAALIKRLRPTADRLSLAREHKTLVAVIGCLNGTSVILTPVDGVKRR